MTLAKYRRTELGFSHRDVATLSALTTSEISLIETGRLRPTDQQLEKLAKALHVLLPSALIEPVQLVDAQRAALEEAVSA